MSMLSSLRDELRNVAIDVECIYDDNFVVGRDSVILTKAAMLMRRAADTIWQLRNDYVKLRDENERLRMNANPTAGELRRVREAWEKDREKLLAECQHSQRLAENLEAGERENDKLRKAVATAIKVQTVLCRDADSLYCRNKCPLHRPESNDCLACDVIGLAQELEIEVKA